MNNLILVSILSAIFVVTLLSFPSPAEAVYLYHICPNTTTFTPNSTFQSNLNRLLSTLSSNATRPSGFYNATASSRTPNDTVFGLFRCRGDVAATDTCKSCVSTATSEAVQRCPTEKQVVIGGRVFNPSCYVGYEVYPFYLQNSTSAPQPSPGVLSPPPPLPPKGKSKISKLTIVAIVAPIAVSVLLFIAGCCFITRREQERSAVQQQRHQAVRMTLVV